MEKLGIIRGEGGLANRSRPVELFKGVVPPVGASLLAKNPRAPREIRIPRYR
ncbi:hypothetical protein C4J93_4958 [Pseudomonas sp. R2-37-08W]|nr:hypothetical protein C4J93_4958 [Pseudomonas sp. R2-37-08W]AZF18365.1 hypothetical protein C4J92_4928 [Pseudomonas sp. R3-18-08]AZF23786.1 hypothetical protein C4J91_5084 [Pseudomonas sp. R3-52-08]AZF55487.1 hypothetical protein C4J85_5050 [Pseudomonas sp. R4-34-07]